MSAAEDIRGLLARFAFLVDAEPTLDPAVTLFTADGEWAVGDAVATGPAEIAPRLARGRDAGFAGPGSGNRHLITTIEIELTGADTATARSYWLLVKGGDATACLMVGEYRDTLRRDGDGWRFTRREVVVAPA
jgi:hypothetical protein